MMHRWLLLPETELGVFRTTIAFVEGRLSERATVEWALSLEERDVAKRWAVLEVLHGRSARLVGEPWRTAWRLVEESWEGGLTMREGSLAKYDVADRIKSGERTGALIASILNLVRPFIKVSQFSKLDRLFRRLPRTPRSVQDLMSIELTSGELVDPKELAIETVEDGRFLLELAHDLDAAVTKALDIGHRLFGNPEDRLWRLGDLKRVYFVQESDRPEGEDEPDRFHTGIAPSTKLLYAVVSRLHDVDAAAAMAVLRRWRETPTPIHVRLWSAFSREARVSSATEVSEFLESTHDHQFWDLHRYPEVAELRARRFSTLAGSHRKSIVRRLRKGPPASHWPRKSSRELVTNARRYWTAREMRRIQLAGGDLPEADERWLHDHVGEFEELKDMSRIDDGFIGTSKMGWVAPNPDDRFDFLVGAERLEALEEALSAQRHGWDDDPATRASDWIGTADNVRRLVTDFEAADTGGTFPRVWDRFGWRHSPMPLPDSEQRDVPLPRLEPVAERVLALLERLPIGTAQEAIGGISHWLDRWAQQIHTLPHFVNVWLRLWPVAVAATNAEQAPEAEPSLSVVVTTPGRDEPQDLDTLNTPAGRLVGALLAACPRIGPGDRPFESIPLREMRDAALAAEGRAALVVRHRFITGLPYFLQADPAWTRSTLIEPLLADTPQAIVLWRAVARKTRFREVLEIIGEAMATRAVDIRLGRETRRSLSFSIVIEVLHALYSDRSPVVPIANVLQMIRSLDDEVRSHAANAVQRFVHDLSVPSSNIGAPDSPETLFRKAAHPFLEKVWPQERSLATPGVARAFADLPSTCRDSFAEAVDAVERFLVPFDCWSMLDFGLYGEANEGPRLSTINTAAKAEAFLRLLDLTIGSAQGSVVPSDLGTALAQIERVAPRIAESQQYRRLAAIARR
jgi:hypothetical protein